jgi:hypothetical protein
MGFIGKDDLSHHIQDGHFHQMNVALRPAVMPQFLDEFSQSRQGRLTGNAAGNAFPNGALQAKAKFSVHDFQAEVARTRF